MSFLLKSVRLVMRLAPREEWIIMIQSLYDLSEIFLARSRKMMLKLRWSCFEYFKYLSYDHNFFLAQRTILKTPSTNLEHDRETNRHFFRASWKNQKKFDIKNESFIIDVEIFQPNFCFIFSDLQGLHFSWLSFNPCSVRF